MEGLKKIKEAQAKGENSEKKRDQKEFFYECKEKGLCVVNQSVKQPT